MCSSCSSLRRPELCATRSWIVFELVELRRRRFLREDADATSVRQRTKRVLDDAVFQRMKGDHYEPGAGLQPADDRFQKICDVFELPIHPDAQRLKRPSRGIDAGRATARNRSSHDGGQLG